MKMQTLFRRITRPILALLAGLAVPLAARAGDSAAGPLTTDHPSVKAVIAVQKDLTTDLMKVPGVLGTAVGLGNSGDAALVVYVDLDSPNRADIVRALPPQLRGVG